MYKNKNNIIKIIKINLVYGQILIEIMVSYFNRFQMYWPSGLEHRCILRQCLYRIERVAHKLHIVEYHTSIIDGLR